MEGISFLQPTIHNIAYNSCDAYPTITGLVWLGLVWLGSYGGSCDAYNTGVVPWRSLLLNVAILEVISFG